MRAIFVVAFVLALSACTRDLSSAPTLVPPSNVSARADGSGYSVLYSFYGGAGGYVPTTALAALGGTLYGTTVYGGATATGAGCTRCGTVYAQTTGGTNKDIYRFSESGDAGITPRGDLVAAHGALYGTTELGGRYKCSGNGCGAVYRVSPDGTEKTLYAFAGRSPGRTDGGNPRGGLVIGGNNGFYGTTSHGGAGFGTVFGITLDGDERVIYRFAGSPDDGDAPVGDLAKLNQTLYGVTEKGGAHNLGCIFEVTIKGTEKLLHSFNGDDGAEPAGGLVSSNETLYGVATFGGPHQRGVVFSITPSGQYHIVHAFRGSEGGDGAFPRSPPILIYGTVMYGTTHGGGSTGHGTIYQIDHHGKEAVIHSFGKAPDGELPVSKLFYYQQTLYGTTAHGGDHSGGTIFKLTPP